MGDEARDDIIEVVVGELVLLEEEEGVDVDFGAGDVGEAREGGAGLAQASEVGDVDLEGDVLEGVAEADILDGALDAPELAPDEFFFFEGVGFDTGC